MHIRCSFSAMASPEKKPKLDDLLVVEQNQPPSLTASVLSQSDSNALLIFLLENPNGCNTIDVLDEFCNNHEIGPAVSYLLSLPHSHWHRPVVKKHLSARFETMTIVDLHQLGRQYLPLKSALTDIDGEKVAAMGPLTDLDAAAWDTNDWFFRMLHSRRMEGEHTLLFDIPLPIYIRARLSFETE